MLSHLMKGAGNKEPALFKGIRRSSQRLAYRDSEDGLKILLRILSITFTLSSLSNLRDQATYIWSTLDTIQMHSATHCCIVQRITLSVGRSTFNPHWLTAFSFLQTREYRLHGIAVLEHWLITIRRVGRRVVAWWESLIFLCIGDENWTRFDLGCACVKVQEVES